jgi:hypothetical protein
MCALDPTCLTVGSSRRLANRAMNCVYIDRLRNRGVSLPMSEFKLLEQDFATGKCLIWRDAGVAVEMSSTCHFGSVTLIVPRAGLTDCATG